MIPPVACATGDIACIRFSGRNTETWWVKFDKRYNYNHNAEGLEEWNEKIGCLKKRFGKFMLFKQLLQSLCSKMCINV